MLARVIGVFKEKVPFLLDLKELLTFETRVIEGRYFKAKDRNEQIYRSRD